MCSYTVSSNLIYIVNSINGSETEKGGKGKAFGKHLSEFEYDIIFQLWQYESK